MEGKAIKLYVSYFGNAKKLRAADCAIVSIARYNPRFLSNLDGWLKYVAPRGDMLKMSREDYDVEYAKILKRLDPRKVFSDAMKCAGSHQAVALCCYEKDWNDCHRQTVANWLKDHGIECEEFGLPQPKTSHVEQLNIF